MLVFHACNDKTSTVLKQTKNSDYADNKYVRSLIPTTNLMTSTDN